MEGGGGGLAPEKVIIQKGEDYSPFLSEGKSFRGTNSLYLLPKYITIAKLKGKGGGANLLEGENSYML